MIAVPPNLIVLQQNEGRSLGLLSFLLELMCLYIAEHRDSASIRGNWQIHRNCIKAKPVRWILLLQNTAMFGNGRKEHIFDAFYGVGGLSSELCTKVKCFGMYYATLWLIIMTVCAIVSCHTVNISAIGLEKANDDFCLHSSSCFSFCLHVSSRNHEPVWESEARLIHEDTLELYCCFLHLHPALCRSLRFVVRDLGDYAFQTATSRF